MNKFRSFPMDQALDVICAQITNPEALNSLHACRDGHPLGKDNDKKWWNAAYMVAQVPYFKDKIPAHEWLVEKAVEEGRH